MTPDRNAAVRKAVRECAPHALAHGDAVWAVPEEACNEIRSATFAIGTPAHSWQMVGQGRSALAHKGMVQAARVTAATGAAPIARPVLPGDARDEFAASPASMPDLCPMPEEALPPLPASA
ncbi:hypothetical protein [Roseomonas elaeocarpi]|uniref:Uncharacterized protein n=1 Tax=Roseomonas elaeocarpi TaxID=907779 RepID=A0ABV6JPS8_9PROT